MTALSMAAVAAQFANAPFNPDQDLPVSLPNVYWCTADYPGKGRHHTYLAAGHTKAAVQKMANWCADNKGFRPYRSNSTLKVRRLKLGDLMENPDAFAAALANARESGERDVIAGLLALPQWIVQHLTEAPTASPQRVLRPDLPVRPPVDFEAAWTSLQREIAALAPSA